MIYQWWDNRKESHLKSAIFLLEKRNIKIKNVDYFPENGIIYFKDGYDYNDEGGIHIPMVQLVPIAMGFLRKVEPRYGLLDSYITNPDIESRLRHDALSKISEELIARAKELKIKTLMSFSRDKSMIERIKDLGFLQTDFAFFELSFKEDK